MYPKQYILEQHIVLRHYKEHYWYEHQENDPPPALAVRWRDMDMQSINLGSIIYGLAMQMSNRPAKMRQRLMRPERILWGVLTMISQGEKYPPEVTPPPKPDTPLEAIWFALEGYRQPTGLGPDATVREIHDQLREMHQEKPGDMEERYKSDPDSGIYEILTSYIVETGPLGTAEWARATSGVHKGDAGRLVWDSAEIISSDDEDHQLIVVQDGLIPLMTKFVTRENLT